MVKSIDSRIRLHLNPMLLQNNFVTLGKSFKPLYYTPKANNIVVNYN